MLETIRKDGFGSVMEGEEEFKKEGNVESLEEWKKYYCEVCRQELNGGYSWKLHLQSKRHQKHVKYEEKRAETEEFIKEQREKARLRKIER